jgi:UDP-2,3-diacylglucosamine hydrolase
LNNNKTHIYFASDFHLGVPSFEASLEREKKICAWLDAIAPNAKTLYLVGDIFDFWYEYKQVVPKGFTRLLGKLAHLSDQGLEIYFFKGNHDMWTFGYLEQEIGLKVIDAEHTFTAGQKTFYVHHGDGVGPGDKGYKFIKRIFRHPLSIKLFGFLHPRIGVGLAQYLSRKSRISQGQNDKQYKGDENEFIVQHCKQILTHTHYDYFVCGHRHFPITLALNEQSSYINLGEWVNDFTYAEFNGETLELKHF